MRGFKMQISTQTDDQKLEKKNTCINESCKAEKHDLKSSKSWL